jgi:hypothetical protein
LTGPNRQAGEWATVSRSLFLYLLVAWLLVRYGSASVSGLPPSELVSLAVLAGFPVAALIAARLGRGARSGRWWVAGVAVVVAAIPALACLHWQSEELSPDEIVLTPAVAAADGLSTAELARAHEGLRLRVRGLSVRHPGADSEFDDGSAAEILLVTSVRDGDHGEELVISATLVSAETGGVIWQAEYTGDPHDLVAVRRLLIKALTEAMSLTREGVSGGQIV